MKTCLRTAFGLLFVLLSLSATAEDYVNQILILTGASRLEDLTEDEVERYERYARRPLNLNMVSLPILMSSGLLSDYQAASVADYRSLNGDVLSFSELARLDGFDERVAEALKPFVSLESRSSPGGYSLAKSRICGEVISRFQFRSSAASEYAYLVKGSVESDNRFRLSASAKSPWSHPVASPSAYAFSASLYSRTLPVTLVLGDFNARMGEGLLLWSGFSTQLPSTAAQFDRHPSAISGSASMSAGFRGVAGLASFGRLSASLFWAMPMTFGLDVTRYGRNLHLGGSAYYSKGKDSAGVSIHSRTCLNGFDLFGECAAVRTSQTLSVSGLAGIIWTPDYNLQFSSALRYYPEVYNAPFASPMRASSKAHDELALALGMRLHSVDATMDLLSYPSGKGYQLKFLCSAPLSLAEGLSLNFRLSERMRLLRGTAAPTLRSDLRADLICSFGRLKTTMRINVLNHIAWAWLGYLEAGLLPAQGTGVSFNSYLRMTIFKVDNWDDRIYSYERDAPYNFNVPSYYGRGYRLSLLSGLKIPVSRSELSLYLNSSFISYPFMKTARKPSRLELKLQAAIKF